MYMYTYIHKHMYIVHIGLHIHIRYQYIYTHLHTLYTYSFTYAYTVHTNAKHTRLDFPSMYIYMLWQCILYTVHNTYMLLYHRLPSTNGHLLVSRCFAILASWSIPWTLNYMAIQGPKRRPKPSLHITWSFKSFQIHGRYADFVTLPGRDVGQGPGTCSWGATTKAAKEGGWLGLVQLRAAKISSNKAKPIFWYLLHFCISVGNQEVWHPWNETSIASCKWSVFNFNRKICCMVDFRFPPNSETRHIFRAELLFPDSVREDI